MIKINKSYLDNRGVKVLITGYFLNEAKGLAEFIGICPYGFVRTYNKQGKCIEVPNKRKITSSFNLIVN